MTLAIVCPVKSGTLWISRLYVCPALNGELNVRMTFVPVASTVAVAAQTPPILYQHGSWDACTGSEKLTVTVFSEVEPRTATTVGVSVSAVTLSVATALTVAVPNFDTWTVNWALLSESVGLNE